MDAGRCCCRGSACSWSAASSRRRRTTPAAAGARSAGAGDRRRLRRDARSHHRARRLCVRSNWSRRSPTSRCSARLGPMISPFIGGLLTDTFGWRSVFGFALLAGGGDLAGSLFRASTRRVPPRAGHEWRRRSAQLCCAVRTSALHGVRPANRVQHRDVLGDGKRRSRAHDGICCNVRPPSSVSTSCCFPLGYFIGNFISTRIGSGAADRTHGAGRLALSVVDRRHPSGRAVCPVT